MGSDIPKQFVPVAGKPVLMRTLEVFTEALDDLHLILVLPTDQQEYWAELCDKFHFSVPHQIATGGDTRFHSVQSGLALVPDDAEGVVGVHDGVRPFVTPEVIRRCYDAAWDVGAVVPVVPVVETMRQLLPEGDSQTVDRTTYRLVQTPQVFRVSLFKEAMRQPYQPDASVVEALGHNVGLVDGNRENIKITTSSDLAYAEYLCRELT